MNIIYKTKTLKYINILIIIILLFAVGAMTKIQEKNDLYTNAETISNKKIGWGIKRNNTHEQPDVGVNNRKVLEKHDGITLGNKEKKYVYLTFDEGYEAGYTPDILDTLKENNVKATFFLTAHYINTQEELVKRMIEEGHIIGNHTVNHKSMPDLSEEQIKDEIMKLHTAVQSKFNYEMKYIRPPKGEFSEKSLSTTTSLGYKTVMWSFAYEDWNESNQPDKQKSKEKIISNIHNGAIILLHGNSKTNTDILGDVIKEINNTGYEFKSLDEFEK